MKNMKLIGKQDRDTQALPGPTERKLPNHIVAAGAIVLNDRGEVLLIKDDRRHSWTFPGGIVEEGEGLLDGVKREVLEETGIEVEVGQLFCVTSNTCKHPGYNGVREVPPKVMLDFVCRAIGGTPRPSEENSQTAYFPLDQARKLITAPAIAVRFQAYLAYTGRPAFLEYVTWPTYELKTKVTV